MTGDGRTFVDKREVPRKDLAGELSQEMQRMPGAPLVVKGDAAIAYGTVREIIREIAKAGVPGVSLAAAQLKPGGSS